MLACRPRSTVLGLYFAPSKSGGQGIVDFVIKDIRQSEDYLSFSSVGQ